MHGVCIDPFNPLQRPTVAQLQALYRGRPSYVRAISVQSPVLEEYLSELAGGGVSYHPLFTNQSFTTDDPASEIAGHVALWTRSAIPLTHITWGNEPGAPAGAVSSDVKTPREFADWWNALIPAAVSALRENVHHYLAGQLGPPGAWIEEAWPLLDPRPDGIDVHYPDVEEDLEAYEKFGVPLAVGEWAWTGPSATRRKVVNWQRMIDRHTQFSSWFRWGPGADAPGLELVDADGHPLTSYYRYQDAVSASA